MNPIEKSVHMEYNQDMNKGDDIITTFIGGCFILATLGILSITILSWIFA
jgi:hypothetical protein